MPKIREVPLEHAETVPAQYGECPYCGFPAEGRVCDRCRALAVQAEKGDYEALERLYKRASAG
jgi:hypothetical protein